ncbi:Flagellar basal-body rod modification protein FlgD [hydrothermal vent metagenome]|uniref:Flagellar basal-body rod modification protein FlgD n=1 Tax=hydrothermal vent metagenome TaxID=652676 RepID=A0A3B0ZES0_9ZZZZ
MSAIEQSVLDNLNISRRPQASGGDEIGQEGFLKLMTAQMNNQDPTKPMESGEFFSQIAQFSSVAGIQDLQNSFSQVATALQSNQALQASTMVGRTVMIPSGEAVFNGEDPVVGKVAVPDATNQLIINVLDDTGQVVKTMNMGTRNAGVADFSWDGRNEEGELMPKGDYTIKAIATTSNESIELGTLLAERVESVTLGSGGITLDLASDRSVPMSGVKQVL